MKFVKHLIIYEVACIVLVLFLYLEFSYMMTGMVSAGDNNQASLSEISAQLPHIKSEIYLNNQTLLVNEEIKFIKPSKDIWLNIPANLYSTVKIKSIAPENHNVEMLNDNLAMHISLNDSSDSISIQYELNLEKSRGILCYTNDKVTLTEYLVTPAPYVKDKFVLSKRVVIGDPFVYPLCDYETILDADSAYEAFAPGKETETENGVRKSYSFKTEAVRDFPIALIKNPTITKQKIRDIDVTYVGMPDVQNEVEKTFDYIEKRTTKYPYKQLFIINAPIESQGMEFSQMIFISDNIISSAQTLNRVVQHEVLHQWFYGMIGTDQMNEPFMDEGLVCYLVKDLNGEEVSAKYNEKLFHLDLSQYKSKNDYYSLVYGDGTALFEYLHEKYGDEFDKCLRSIFLNYNGKIVTYEDFVNALEQSENGDD